MHEALNLSDQELKTALLVMSDLKRAWLKSGFEASAAMNGSESSPVTQGFYNGFNAPEFKELREQEAELIVKWLRDPVTKPEDIAPRLAIDENHKSLRKVLERTVANNAGIADLNECQKERLVNKAIEFQKETTPLFVGLERSGTGEQILNGLDMIIEISRQMNVPIESLPAFSEVDHELMRGFYKTRAHFEAESSNALENLFGKNGTMKILARRTLNFMVDLMLISSTPFASDEELAEIKLSIPVMPEDAIDKDLMKVKETTRNYHLELADRIFGPNKTQ